MLCLSILNSPVIQEFSGAMVSTGSPSIVPMAPSGHVIELLGSSALQLEHLGPQTVELRLGLAPEALLYAGGSFGTVIFLVADPISQFGTGLGASAFPSSRWGCASFGDNSPTPL